MSKNYKKREWLVCENCGKRRINMYKNLRWVITSENIAERSFTQKECILAAINTYKKHKSEDLASILEKNERLYRSVIYYYLFPYDEPYRKLYQLINEGAFFGSKNGDIQYGYPAEKKDFFENHISFLKNDKFRVIKAIEQIYSNNRKYHWIANHSQLFIAA